MSDFRPFSAVEAAQGAAVIQNARTNALALAAEQEKQRRLSPLMAAAASGDLSATRGVVALDPDLGNKIITATSSMNEAQRTQFKYSVETKGRSLQAVMNAPEIYKEQAWQQAKEDIASALGPEAIVGMPEKFDPNWTQMNIDKALSVSELLDARGTAFQPTLAYDKDGKLVFMQASNVPGKAPTVIKDLTPINKTEEALEVAEGKAKIDAENAAKIEGGKAAGKSAIEKSDKAIEDLTTVRRNVSNIDEAIAAIDAGAKSGAIESKFPSITAASVELDNIRSRMGLDVISGTTFGALSEGELKFALDSAVPKNLNEKDLRVWLLRKKEAQQKLAQELEAAAIYLGKPGNTPAGYLEFLRNQQASQPAPSQAKPTTPPAKSTTPDVSNMSNDDLLNF